MRICMLTYSFYESDNRILRYATALAQRGDSVDVLALRRDGSPSFEVLDGVNVHRIQRRRVNEKGRLSYLRRMCRFLLRSAYILTRKHLKHPYQLIHVHSVPDFLVFAAVLPRLLGARVILDIHDILPEFYGSKFRIGPHSAQFKLLLLEEKVSTAFANHVIIANHLWKERIVARSVPESKCTAICNYPDLQVFRPRTKQRTSGKFIIIYPGSLNAHQGLDVALRAFAKLTDQIPSAEFHIYGEGPERQALAALSESLGLDGRVRFHGPLPIREIAGVMASSDLAVVPKRASSAFGNEAASTKIMEFMALGVPVIVSRTKVDSYYFNDSLVKFFESGNESDLADSILEIYHNAGLREVLTANASGYIQQNNWDAKKTDYLHLVDALTHAERVPA
jgi:glycosyltransferase involved in cell wall biosynthesis